MHNRRNGWEAAGGFLRGSALMALLVVVAGCGGGSATSGTTVPSATAPPVSTPVTSAGRPPGAGATGVATRALATATAASPTMARTSPVAATRAATPPPTSTPAAVDFRVETVAAGLEAPWDLAFAPDGRIFVTERPGRLRVIEGGQLRPEPVATLPEVAARGEGGLLGLALAPDFAQSRALYLYHTYSEGGALRNRVVRFTEEGNRLRDPRIILDGIPGATIHDGGRIAFGPDGKLYITTGDAAQPDLAQNRDSLGGKILRLNPDGSIPGDNPFPGSPVYSYGHRNPQGLAWQPGTNQLYVTEHGPSAQDEVNRIVPGGNYGWPAMRGNEGRRDGLTGPVIASGAGTTWAPSGATFVSAGTFPQWRGDLLFAGLRSATLWRVDLADDGSARLHPLLADEYGRLRTVIEGPDGLLYVLTSSRDGRGSPGQGDDRLLRLAPR